MYTKILCEELFGVPLLKPILRFKMHSCLCMGMIVLCRSPLWRFLKGLVHESKRVFFLLLQTSARFVFSGPVERQQLPTDSSLISFHRTYLKTAPLVCNFVTLLAGLQIALKDLSPTVPLKTIDTINSAIGRWGGGERTNECRQALEEVKLWMP